MSATKKDLEELARTWDERMAKVEETLGEVSSGLQSLKTSSKGKQEKLGEGTTDQYCPECQTYTKDLYQHLKKDPDKHGLLKTVEKEVVKEVPKKRTVAEILSEHDLFDCPDCRKVIDEHLSKKGLKITTSEEEGKEGELSFI